MTDATLDTTGPKPAVRLERRLPDPPAVVWRAITERDQLKTWFPCDVIVEGGRWEVGAAISFPFPPGVIEMTLTGTVLAADEPSRPMPLPKLPPPPRLWHRPELLVGGLVVLIALAAGAWYVFGPKPPAPRWRRGCWATSPGPARPPSAPSGRSASRQPSM